MQTIAGEFKSASVNGAVLSNDSDGPTSYFPQVFDYQLSKIIESIGQPVLLQCVNTCDCKVFVSIVL